MPSTTFIPHFQAESQENSFQVSEQSQASIYQGLPPARPMVAEPPAMGSRPLLELNAQGGEVPRFQGRFKDFFEGSDHFKDSRQEWQDSKPSGETAGVDGFGHGGIETNTFGNSFMNRNVQFGGGQPPPARADGLPRQHEEFAYAPVHAAHGYGRSSYLPEPETRNGMTRAKTPIDQGYAAYGHGSQGRQVPGNKVPGRVVHK